MQKTSYLAHPKFLSAHEWVHSGLANIVADSSEAHAVNRVEPSGSSKVVVVSRVMANPHLLKLSDLGNYNDRFMKMDSAKWVVHLSRPIGTLFDKDWELLVTLILGHRLSKGISCSSESDEALEKYVHKVSPRFQSDMKELSPWWKLNILKIMNARGDVIPPGDAQEKSMQGSLVEVTFSIKHFFIKTSNTDSFNASLSSAQIMVSGLRHEEAEEAYEAYIAKIPLPEVEERTVLGLTSGLEDTISSMGTEREKTMDSQNDIEEDNSRKRKGWSGGGIAKKAKLNG
ncbi:hypothetical protein F5146DRAFT_1006839 [Armillaria mellea]|nr:hypothetical protein F5146DRAFT_1006839 [Armillaria mellea]